MESGLVKWFNNAKGWGFISLDDGSDVFVHYSQIRGDGYRTLKQGEPVTFALRTGPRGHFAEDVHMGVVSLEQTGVPEPPRAEAEASGGP